MEHNLILEIIQSFYDTAKRDVMIGYHFRIIENFEEHIPRIADFWNLQLNGVISDKSNLPFNLIAVHKDLGIKKAEMGRWIMLFKQNLEVYVTLNKIDFNQQKMFMEKVDHMRSKIEPILFPQKQQ